MNMTLYPNAKTIKLSVIMVRKKIARIINKKGLKNYF